MRTHAAASRDPLFRELNALHDKESELDRRYMTLRRAKNPSRALRMRFAAEVLKLQLRVEALDQVLRATDRAQTLS